MSDTERMLIETVQVMESMNLMELLPFEVIAWYGARRLEAEVEENESIRLMERRAEHFASADAVAAQTGQRSVPEPVVPVHTQPVRG